MNNILSEKDYQKFLLERLSKDNGYIIRKATNFDRLFAVDREMLFKFLNDSKVLIIDAKYYANTTQAQYDKHTLHSNNLYQIFTYVKNKDSVYSLKCK